MLHIYNFKRTVLLEDLYEYCQSEEDTQITSNEITRSLKVS